MPQDIVEYVLKAIAWIVGTGVITAGGVWLGLKAFAEKWLENKFKLKLQNLQAEQAQSLKQFEHQLNRTFDRAIKLHAKEFEVLPIAWAKLNKTFWQVKGYTSPMQSYPDFNAMTEAQTEYTLENSPLVPYQKDLVRSAPLAERTNVFMTLPPKNESLVEQ